MAEDDNLLSESTAKKFTEEEEERNDSSSDSSDDTSSDTSDVEFECTACDKRFSGYLPYKQHQRGKKHARVAARRKEEAKAREKEGGNDLEFCLPEPFAACGVCRKEFSGPESYHAHLRSKHHKQKVAEVSVLRQVRAGSEIDLAKLGALLTKRKNPVRPGDQQAATTLDDDHLEFECEACEKVFSGLTPYAQHLTSKMHARRAEGRRKVEEMAEGGGTICLEEDDVLVCKACTVSFSGPESAAMHLKSKKHVKQLDRYVRKLERRREKEAEKASKKSGDKKSDINVELPDPSVVRTQEALPSADGKAEKTSKEPRDKDVPHMSEASVLKKMDAVPSADKEDFPYMSDASVPKKIDKGIGASSDDDVDRAFDRYKEYKKLMNSLHKDDSLF